MTLFTGLPALTPSPTSVPSIGDIVYLASYAFQVGVTAAQTMPDTPPMYSANIGVQGDRGEMNLDPLAGPPGDAGQARFSLRDQTKTLPLVNSPTDLPDDLTNTKADIGKYWLIDTLDDTGHVTMVTAYVWYGDQYRTFMSGSYGPPGAIPKVRLSVETIDPNKKSYVLSSGTTTAPTWKFGVASPPGPTGISGLLGQFPDMDEFSGFPQPYDILAHTGGFNDDGQAIFQPVRLDQGIVGMYSMPEGSFWPYAGVSQQALVGAYSIPPQPFPWTPVVWGHIGGTGLSLSTNPFRVGCQAVLGHPTVGQQVGRGLGNTMGVVNIMPHYSQPSNSSAAITPKNKMAVVPAYHTGTEGTVYVNLYNDGAEQAFFFSPRNAQLFIMVVPIQPSFTSITGVPVGPVVVGVGSLSANATIGRMSVTPTLPGTGTLSATVIANKFFTTTPFPGHGRLFGSAGSISSEPPFHGHGQLSAAVYPKLPSAAAFHGTGTAHGYYITIP